MDLYNLTLSEYRASTEAVYPAEFGGFVPFAGQVQPIVEPTPPVPSGFESTPAPQNETSLSSGYSNISESAYKMLERYVILS